MAGQPNYKKPSAKKATAMFMSGISGEENDDYYTQLVTIYLNDR